MALYTKPYIDLLKAGVYIEHVYKQAFDHLNNLNQLPNANLDPEIQTAVVEFMVLTNVLKVLIGTKNSG